MTTRDAAIELVDRYLQLCEERALDEAASMWAPGPMHLEFPGPVVYTSLSALVEASRAQYAWVCKRRDSYSVDLGAISTTVTIWGRLYGENLQGAPFDGVRYVDIFRFRDGLIREQRVWNDLAVGDALTRTR